MEPMWEGGPAAERVLYRDGRHIVYWDGGYYVMLDLMTRSRRYYADVRDVFGVMNRIQREEYEQLEAG